MLDLTGHPIRLVLVRGPRVEQQQLLFPDQHMVGVQRSSHRQAIGGQPLPNSGIEHYQGFVREAANEIDTVFPRLPNPTLVMYIFPHLSGSERTPVLGYVTTFPFYETVEYALPGEVPMEAAVPLTSDK